MQINSRDLRFDEPTAVQMEAEWVNLLRTPENGEEETGKRRAASERRRERTVRVSENTPVGGGKAGVNKSKRSELQVLRSQVCVLVREKQDLSQSVREEGGERDSVAAFLVLCARAFYYLVRACCQRSVSCAF